DAVGGRAADAGPRPPPVADPVGHHHRRDLPRPRPDHRRPAVRLVGGGEGVDDPDHHRAAHPEGPPPGRPRSRAGPGRRDLLGAGSQPDGRRDRELLPPERLSTPGRGRGAIGRTDTGQRADDQSATSRFTRTMPRGRERPASGPSKAAATSSAVQNVLSSTGSTAAGWVSRASLPPRILTIWPWMAAAWSDRR